jgi:hypothetical protein
MPLFIGSFYAVAPTYLISLLLAVGRIRTTFDWVAMSAKSEKVHANKHARRKRASSVHFQIKCTFETFGILGRVVSRYFVRGLASHAWPALQENLLRLLDE